MKDGDQTVIPKNYMSGGLQWYCSVYMCVKIDLSEGVRKWTGGEGEKPEIYWGNANFAFL